MVRPLGLSGVLGSVGDVATIDPPKTVNRVPAHPDDAAIT